MREGSLEAPIRHPLDWQNPSFYDEVALDTELRRVFDICHGCRRCFNLCDSFPRLFDLIDESKSGELDTVDSSGFKNVVDACTLCDMCFMTKCPYVPPHEFDLDFPHLMLRYRAVEAKKNENSSIDRALAETDRNGKFAGLIAGAVNWATQTNNGVMRMLEEKVTGIDRRAELPRYEYCTLQKKVADQPPLRDMSAPAKNRRVVFYASCFGEYNDTLIGVSALAVLAKNGVETKVVYPQCCGMPKLEQGLIGEVAKAAREVSQALAPYIDEGYDVVAPVPSCALMMKFEWPLILPEDETVLKLSKATFDLSEYIVDIARKEGLAEGMRPVEGGVSFHVSCHSRAQNIGQKGAELLTQIPQSDVNVIERCSGHGGAWGYKKDHFETAMKIGKPAAKQLYAGEKKYVVSECPLAGIHIDQEIKALDGAAPKPERVSHPIVLMAQAYGLLGDDSVSGGRT